MKSEGRHLHIEDIPDLAIAAIISHLSWPKVIGAFLVSKRFHECGNATMHEYAMEQHTASNLSKSMSYCRVRAQLPPNAKSTIALAFSSDCNTLASTHGDHTVKLVDVMRAKITATLQGHPRTPWTVKFHPTEPHIVASGCLGGELRIWDSRTQTAVNHATLPHPVISLSFHPDGTKLAAAAGTSLYIWDLSTRNSVPLPILQTKASLRCVRFLDEERLLVGVRSRSNNVGNPSYIRAARAMLLLYQFDAKSIVERKELLDNATVIVRRALLYNDAGLDVTSDTKSVLTCAEFWVKPESEGGGPVEVGENQEDEDDEMEKQGFKRVAHLIRVSLERCAEEASSSSPRDAMQVELKGGSLLGQLVSCASLEGLWGGIQGGTFVTSVKLSPSGAFVLLGCSRGNFEGQDQKTNWRHPVAAVWRLGDMQRMDTLTCAEGDEDDANVALFHPKSGAGVVYGTKQGQIACALNSAELKEIDDAHEATR